MAPCNNNTVKEARLSKMFSCVMLISLRFTLANKT